MPSVFEAKPFEGKRSGGGLLGLVFFLKVGPMSFQTDRAKSLILQCRTRATEGRERLLPGWPLSHQISLYSRLSVEVCPCKHVLVRLYAPTLRPQGWTPADGWWLHQQPPRYCRGLRSALCTMLVHSSLVILPCGWLPQPPPHQEGWGGTRFPWSMPRENVRLASAAREHMRVCPCMRMRTAYS